MGHFILAHWPVYIGRLLLIFYNIPATQAASVEVEKTRKAQGTALLGPVLTKYQQHPG